MADTNYRSIADIAGVHLNGETIQPPDPENWDDTLKFSKAEDCSASNCSIYGCRENAVDMNRFCKSVGLHSCHLLGGKQAAIVVKGGCKDIAIDEVVITPDKASWCDILWDDYSDQSKEPSSGAIVNTYRSDSKPVRLVFGRWHCPTVLGGNVKTCWIKSIGLHAYNMAKDLIS